MNHKIAICIGHSRTINGRIEGGAVAWDGHENEWKFNRRLAGFIHNKITSLGISSIIYCEYAGDNYYAAMRNLANRIKADGCTAAIELHFNSAGPLAHGHEVLFCAGSARGEPLAKALDKMLDETLSTPDRGIKGLSHSDRGWPFVYLTHCPAVILEPFFGSSKADWQAVASQPAKLAECIATAIKNWCEVPSPIPKAIGSNP
jgi:N-acetylmuramoyl-L-alanine amidase